MHYFSALAALLAGAVLAACATPQLQPAAPIPSVAPTAAAAAFGRITDLSAEPNTTLYRVKLPDGSQRSARSAQPFPIGACVELADDATVRESTRCR